MNMILCSENCTHQKEGYCALNGPSKLSASTAAKCAYYENVSGTRTQSSQEPGRFPAGSGQSQTPWQ